MTRDRGDRSNVERKLAVDDAGDAPGRLVRVAVHDPQRAPLTRQKASRCNSDDAVASARADGIGHGGQSRSCGRAGCFNTVSYA
ncbi:hypothetical protein [Halorubrum lacusprofundi]|jgi:hypothetical protein|uniref:hypothetical protein n=1 Tax=Halorubrum lacusprofundi TaxID=2247 RepID=UPI0011316A00|nr:hypothetical protein [Halorubrum lacusprofundi]MCG1008291.1 hypothetical protein [Halorubrum lacusprofundi]